MLLAPPGPKLISYNSMAPAEKHFEQLRAEVALATCAPVSGIDAVGIPSPFNKKDAAEARIPTGPASLPAMVLGPAAAPDAGRGCSTATDAAPASVLISPADAQPLNAQPPNLPAAAHVGLSQYMSARSSTAAPAAALTPPAAPVRAAVAAATATGAAVASSKRRLEGSLLLQQLLSLSGSLAEAAKQGDSQRLYFLITLLDSIPMTGQLLFASQVAHSVRQAAQQLVHHHNQAGLSTLQQQQQGQDAPVLLETVRRLLKRWKAVLAAEVAAADASKAAKARQVLRGKLQRPSSTHQQPLMQQTEHQTLQQANSKAAASGLPLERQPSLQTDHQQQQRRQLKPHDHLSTPVQQLAASGGYTAAGDKARPLNGRVAVRQTAGRKRSWQGPQQQQGGQGTMPAGHLLASKKHKQLQQGVHHRAAPLVHHVQQVQLEKPVDRDAGPAVTAAAAFHSHKALGSSRDHCGAAAACGAGAGAAPPSRPTGVLAAARCCSLRETSPCLDGYSSSFEDDSDSIANGDSSSLAARLASAAAAANDGLVWGVEGLSGEDGSELDGVLNEGEGGWIPEGLGMIHANRPPGLPMEYDDDASLLVDSPMMMQGQGLSAAGGFILCPGLQPC